MWNMNSFSFALTFLRKKISNSLPQKCHEKHEHNQCFSNRSIFGELGNIFFLKHFFTLLVWIFFFKENREQIMIVDRTHSDPVTRTKLFKSS